MKYMCKLCNYESCDKSNYSRHLKSSSHKHLSGEDNSYPENYPVATRIIKTEKSEKTENTKKFICENCNESFNHLSNYSRHKNHRCKYLKNNIIDECQENIILRQKVQEYQEQLKIRDIQSKTEIKYLKQQNDELKSFINSGKMAPTVNISIKKYIQQQFSDAPVLEPIKDYPKLTFNEEDLVQSMVSNYNNGTLHKYLGNFLIKYYKKEDPSQQSMWNSDVARLTYMIKELINNNNSIWNNDYKGIKTKDCIVTPFLKYIKKCINEYCGNNIEEYRSIDTDTLIRIQTILIVIQKIKVKINNGELAEDIVRYIAPYFYLDRTNSNNNLVEYIECDED